MHVFEYFKGESPSPPLKFKALFYSYFVVIFPKICISPVRVHSLPHMQLGVSSLINPFFRTKTSLKIESDGNQGITSGMLQLKHLNILIQHSNTITLITMLMRQQSRLVTPNSRPVFHNQMSTSR